MDKLESKNENSISKPLDIKDSSEISYEKFEEWRDGTIKFYNEICVNLQDSETNLFVEEISKAPRCLVQLTKKFCNCDLDCVAESFESLKFDTTCYLYKLDNIFLSTEHIDCDFLNEKVEEAELIDFKNDFSLASFVDIYNLISELCDNKPKALQNLQCIMYNYKDGCKDEKLCSGLKFLNLSNQTCKNEDFEEQIQDIARSIHLNLKNDTIEDIVRSVRSTPSLTSWENSFVKPLILSNTQISKSNILIPLSIYGTVIFAISAISLKSFLDSRISVKKGLSIGLCFFIVILMCLCNLNN